MLVLVDGVQQDFCINLALYATMIQCLTAKAKELLLQAPQMGTGVASAALVAKAVKEDLPGSQGAEKHNALPVSLAGIRKVGK